VEGTLTVDWTIGNDGAYITGLNEFDYLWSCMLTPVSLETQLSHLATKIYKLKIHCCN